MYTLTLNFPDSLEELEWWWWTSDGLVLPEGLRKLTWGSDCKVKLPSGLRELRIFYPMPSLVIPEGLLKFDCGLCQSECHFDLPESVQEVVWSDKVALSHPTIIQHLILKYGREVDLSHHSVYKVTIDSTYIRIKKLPPGLKELAFTVDDMHDPVSMPKGCGIVGGKRPTNVIMEE